MAMGRPTSYKPEYCQQLITHMERGLSFESFAGKCRVARSTLYYWEQKQSDFSDAKKVGMELSRLWWEELGRAGALGEKINPTIWIFNMKNRFYWRDQPDVPEDVKKEEYKAPEWLKDVGDKDPTS